jgi:hypothetical protein
MFMTCASDSQSVFKWQVGCLCVHCQTLLHSETGLFTIDPGREGGPVHAGTQFDNNVISLQPFEDSRWSASFSYRAQGKAQASVFLLRKQKDRDASCLVKVELHVKLLTVWCQGGHKKIKDLCCLGVQTLWNTQNPNNKEYLISERGSAGTSSRAKVSSDQILGNPWPQDDPRNDVNCMFAANDWTERSTESKLPTLQHTITLTQSPSI